MSRRKRFRRTIQILIVIAAILAVIIVVNDRKRVSRQIAIAPAEAITIDRKNAIDRFRDGVRVETISESSVARMDETSMIRFAALLSESFPIVHEAPLSRMTRDDFGSPDNHSLLYQWPGTDPKLNPILLMAHYDVVPIDGATRSRWSHEPFSGHLEEEYVWGRGTLDAKNSTFAIMEAVTLLRQQDFKPRRTIYLAFGHDEEIGGENGNAKVAQWMKSQGIRLSMVLDEGGCIFSDFPGMERSVALIGIAEKGFANIRLTATLPDGGHASMPPPQTAIEVLAAAIARLNHNPLPRRIGPAGELMLDFLGPEMKGPSRWAISNRWLFGSLIRRQLGATESGNAMLRTTIAPTMIRSGVKENVLPTRATATLNCRLLPGDKLSDVVRHIRTTIDDERVDLTIDETSREASRVSSTADDEFGMLHRSIKEVYPDVVVAPFVLVGGTDSYHYQDIAKNIYRFIPARLGADDLKRIHGVDERIAVSDYFDLIHFYVRVIKNLSAHANF